MLVAAAYSVFALFVGFSRYGEIKLGKDQDKPDFPFLTWAAHCFQRASALICCFSACRTAYHYLVPAGTGDAPVWLRLFWAAATGPVTPGLPFSLVLYMVSMAVSLRREGNKRKAVQTDKVPVPDSGQNRLNRLVSFPTATPPCTLCSKPCNRPCSKWRTNSRRRGLDTELTENKESRQIRPEVLHGREADFLYEVRLVEAVKPVFAPGRPATSPPAKIRKNTTSPKCF